MRGNMSVHAVSSRSEPIRIVKFNTEGWWGGLTDGSTAYWALWRYAKECNATRKYRTSQKQLDDFATLCMAWRIEIKQERAIEELSWYSTLWYSTSTVGAGRELFRLMLSVSEMIRGKCKEYANVHEMCIVIVIANSACNMRYQWKWPRNIWGIWEHEDKYVQFIFSSIQDLLFTAVPKDVQPHFCSSQILSPSRWNPTKCSSRSIFLP